MTEPGTGTVPVKRENLLHYHWHQLEPFPGLNVRDFSLQENLDWIETLRGQIRVEGIRTPLHVVVRDGKRLITAGNCRWLAVKAMAEAGEEVPLMPCMPEPKGTNELDLDYRLETDNTQKPFNSLEIGVLIKRLINFRKQTQAQVAARWGKSPSWVSQMLELQEAPEAVQAMVQAKQITPTLAVKVVRQEGPEKAVETLEKATVVAEYEGKDRVTERHVKATHEPVEPEDTAPESTSLPPEPEPEPDSPTPEPKPAPKATRASNAATKGVKDIGGGLLRVTISGTRHDFSHKFWRELAHAILDKTDKVKSED